MKGYASIVLLMGVLTLTGCSPQKSSPNDEPNRLSSYHEPFFSQSARKTQLREAAGLVDTMFRAFARDHHFPAIAYGVVLDGELVLSGADGFTDVDRRIKATTRSMFRIASMTKSFTAMAIVKLRDEGRLALDEPAAKYIRELRDVQYLTDDAPVITIRNLLTMSAGFPEDNPWGDRQLADKPEELLGCIKEGISFSNVPSKEFEYSNMGYAMLGEIISTVSGKPYQSYITEQLLHPLKMYNTQWEYNNVHADTLALGYRWEDGTWKTEPMLHDGIYGAMGGLITTIEDFSRYVSFHLQAWPPRNGVDTGPVKRSSLREMHRPWQFRGLYTRGPCPAASAYGYGLGWMRNCEGIERVSHSGGLPGFGSEYRFYPEHGIGIISFANVTYAEAGVLNSMVMDTLMSLYHFPPRALPASDTLLARKEQLITLWKDWSSEAGESTLERRILAENFYLDRSRDQWIAEAKSWKAAIGTVTSISELIPANQLRGTFTIAGMKGSLEVFFTLTPEHVPRIQELNVVLRETAATH